MFCVWWNPIKILNGNIFKSLNYKSVFVIGNCQIICYLKCVTLALQRRFSSNGKNKIIFYAFDIRPDIHFLSFCVQYCGVEDCGFGGTSAHHSLELASVPATPFLNFSFPILLDIQFHLSNNKKKDIQLVQFHFSNYKR